MKRPRDTAWVRRQQPRHTELWQRVVDHPDMRGRVQDAMDAIAAAYLLSRRHANDPRIRPLMEEASHDAASVAESVAIQVPELAQVYDLDQAVWHYLVGHALLAMGVDKGAVVKKLPPLPIQGVPGTSIRLGAAGAFIPMEASKEERCELEEFLKSYEPETRGRKHGATAATDDKSREAWAMHARGLSRDRICQKLYKLTSAAKDRDLHYDAKLRQVDRWLARGRKLASTDN